MTINPVKQDMLKIKNINPEINISGLNVYIK